MFNLIKRQQTQSDKSAENQRKHKFPGLFAEIVVDIVFSQQHSGEWRKAGNPQRAIDIRFPSR